MFFSFGKILLGFSENFEQNVTSRFTESWLTARKGNSSIIFDSLCKSRKRVGKYWKTILSYFFLMASNKIFRSFVSTITFLRRLSLSSSPFWRFFIEKCSFKMSSTKTFGNWFISSITSCCYISSSWAKTSTILELLSQNAAVEFVNWLKASIASSSIVLQIPIMFYRFCFLIIGSCVCHLLPTNMMNAATVNIKIS